jgi:hypothetical protein
MGGGIVPRDMTANAGENGERTRPADLPTVARTDSVDLDAEGIDTEALAETLHEPVPATTQESPEQTGGSRGRASSDGGTTPATERVESLSSRELAGGSAGVDSASAEETEPVDSENQPDGETADMDSDQRVENPQQVTVSPIALALLDETDEKTVIRRVEGAIDEYVLALLAGTARGDEAEQLYVGLELSPALAAVLGESDVDELFGEDPNEKPVEAWLAGRLEATDGAMTMPLAAASAQQVAAVVHNDEFAFETGEEVVDAAVLWAYGCGSL